MLNLKQSQVMEVSMSREDNSLMFGIGVLAGVTAGIIGGLLFAPTSGEESRKKLEEKVNEISTEISDNCPTAEEAKRQVLETVDVVQFKIEKAIERVKNSIKARQLAKAKDKEHSVYGV